MKPAALDILDVERWRRVESVLDLAFDLDPGDLEAHVARVCAGDPELRRAVEALLAADREASTFLVVPAAEQLSPLFLAPEEPGEEPGGESGAISAPGTAAKDLLDVPPPARLGNYQVLGEIGRGGMGIVYLGRDEVTGRTVAIKALPDAVASDPNRLSRFLSEAKLLGALRHPNVAGSHGIEQAFGRHYLIMEFVAGRTLSGPLREGPLPLGEALDVCAQIAEALAAAHALGIVHRDLKPGNVMLTPGGLVKVLDFGIAKHVAEGEARGGSRWSATGPDGVPSGTRGTLGTPGYMSPEQVLDLPHDARADLFALGCVLYQTLTGVRPFAGGSVHAIITATLNAPADDSRLPGDSPESVRLLVGRLLEKDPSRRFAHAREAAAILSGASAAIAPSSSRPRPLDRGAARLRCAGSPFVGREREIDAVRRLLGRARLVTLTGPGGCGKSRLALEVAEAWDGCASDELWIVDLAPAHDRPSIGAALAAAADVRETREMGVIDALAQRLGGKPGLVVLDNCEHLLAEMPGLITLLLDACPALQVLATSREWLGVSGEQTFPLSALTVPAPDAPRTPDSVSKAESVQLFVACAAPAHGFQLTADNAGRVADICRALDGVPLAIELAAALLGHQTLATIADDLEQRMLHAPAPGSPSAHRDALEAAIQMSYDRLSEDEQRLFRAASAFSGGFDLESAVAVHAPGCDAFSVLDLLTRLVDKSLVAIQYAERIEPRYRSLEPIRQFAAACCDAAHETEIVAARHLACFLGMAEQAAPALLGGADQARWLARVEADHSNVLGALRTCERTADGDRALRLTGAVWWFWYVRGHFAQGRDALRRALALPGPATRARAQALFAAGGLAVFQADYVEGRRLSKAALALFRKHGDRLGAARALCHLALCEGGEQRYSKARGCFADAIEIFRELGDQRRLSATLNNLGVVERQQGDFAAAFAKHQEALDLIHASGDRDSAIVTLVNMALASVRLGRIRDAGQWVDEALEHVEAAGARRAGAAALEVAAEVLAARGEHAPAALLVGAARALRSKIGLSPDPWWRQMLADLVLRLETELGDGGLRERMDAGRELSFTLALESARRELASVSVPREVSGAVERQVVVGDSKTGHSRGSS